VDAAVRGQAHLIALGDRSELLEGQVPGELTFAPGDLALDLGAQLDVERDARETPARALARCLGPARAIDRGVVPESSVCVVVPSKAGVNGLLAGGPAPANAACAAASESDTALSLGARGPGRGQAVPGHASDLRDLAQIALSLKGGSATVAQPLPFAREDR